MDESTPNMIRLVRCLSHGPICTLNGHRWNFTPKRWKAAGVLAPAWCWDHELVQLVSRPVLTSVWSCLFEVLELCEGGELHLDSGWCTCYVLQVVNMPLMMEEKRKVRLNLIENWGLLFWSPQNQYTGNVCKGLLQLSEGEVNTSDVNQTARYWEIEHQFWAEMVKWERASSLSLASLNVQWALPWDYALDLIVEVLD